MAKLGSAIDDTPEIDHFTQLWANARGTVMKNNVGG
jgi:hypothetical protein